MDAHPPDPTADTEAYLRLLTQHDRWLATYVYSLVSSTADAQDILQEVKVTMWKHFANFEAGTNFRAWLFKILTNTFINKYRRSVKERNLSDDHERESVAANFFSHDATDQAANPEDFLLERVMSEDVLKAIDTLPIDFRMVVILADLQEFSYKEIAEILECPVGTVMSRLFRGRKLLQKALRDYAAGVGVTSPDEKPAEAPADLAEYRRKKNAG